MRAQNEKPWLDERPAQTRPIEFLTENGFSIVRSWEIDRVPPPTTGAFCFLVRNPQDAEREIIVQVAAEILELIKIQTRGRLRRDNSFWISCAERHLATHLWEKGDYPAGDRLLIEQLDPADLISAIRWRTS